MIALACAAVFMAAGVGLVVGIALGRHTSEDEPIQPAPVIVHVPMVLDLDAVQAAGDRASLQVRATQLARSGPRHAARPRLQLVTA